MTEPVKRYVTTCDCMSEAVWGDYVRQDDYAQLSQECERLSNELNNMRISWGLMQSERDAALKQVERLTAMLHRASKAESRPEFTQIIAEALSAKP